MKDFYIIDTTLRDGAQAAGVGFSNQEKIFIAKELDSIGVDIIEAGIPASGKEEMNFLYELSNCNLNSEILSWNRMNIEDIKKSIQCGIRNIHISAPSSDIQIKKKLNKDRKWVLEKLREVISYAVTHDCKISVGAEDASRTEKKQLVDFFAIALKYGATRVRYADTLGINNPIDIFETIKNIREKVAIDVDFHGHNDFGMATANTFSAFRAGAKYISCSINGLGERAGNTPLEEIVSAFKYILNYEIHIDTRRFNNLSKIVEDFSGRFVAASKPIVGKAVFSHESGIHVDGLIKDKKNYEFFPPEEVGGVRKILLGKSSGTASVIYKLRELGIDVDKKQAGQILGVIRNW